MKKILLLITAISIAATVSGMEKTFTIYTESFQKITFISNAAVESFEGTTNVVSGNIKVDPDNLSSATGMCKVDMRTLDTGINLRNTHMRENHLHTKDYPYSVFNLKSIEGASSLKPGEKVNFTAKGEFELHGVKREIEIPLQAEWSQNTKETPVKGAAEAIHITGEFSVALADYKIPLPQFLFMKLSDTQIVKIDIWAKLGE